VAIINVSDDVMTTLEKLADARGTDVPGVMAEAIGLERVFVDAQRAGSRLLIEQGGRMDEVTPPVP
jgi:predicted transcriptional regulator